MYGGTKTEMERLIRDSAELTDIQNELGITVDANDMSFGNIINAISVMQKKLDITGTTAEEAATTFTGSMKAMQSSFKDLMGNLSTGRDIKASLKNLLKTTTTFVKDNLIPMTASFVSNIPEVFAFAIQEGIPSVLQSGTEMLKQLGEGIRTGLPELINSAYETVSTFANGIFENIPQILEAGAEVLKSFVESFDLAKVLDIGINLVLSLGQGIINMIPNILGIAGDLVGTIFDKIIHTDWIECGKKIIQGVIDGFGNMWDALVEAVMNIIHWVAEQFIKGAEAIAESDMNNLYYSDRETWERLNGTSNQVSNGNQSVSVTMNGREIARLNS